MRQLPIEIKHKVLASLFIAAVLITGTSFFALHLYAQEKLIESKELTEETDSLILKEKFEEMLADSLLQKEESSTFTAPADTIPNNPLQEHGAFFLIKHKPYKKIAKEDLLFKDYSGFPDIIAEELPAYPLNLGYYGHYNHFSLFGGMPADISFRYNGRPMDDLLYGTLNPAQLQTEAYENIEIYTGSDAVVFSDNASSAFINLQEMRFNTKYPYTKLWYSQAGYDFISADIIFAQNFAKDWNFNLGIRRQAGDGRFENFYLDGWNLRTGLRWNPSDMMSISLSENFTNHGLGLNGGIDADASTDIYDNIAAEPYYDALSERVWGHDITLSASLLLAEDSSSAVSGSAYFSYNTWSKNRPEVLYTGGSDTFGYLEHLSRTYGFSLNYEQEILSFFTLRTGGDIAHYALEKSYYSGGADDMKIAAFGHGTLDIFDDIIFSGGFRISRFKGFTALSAGAKGIFRISDFDLLIDLSRSERLPSAMEGFELSKEKHLLALTEIVWNRDETDITLGAFARKIDSPIESDTLQNEEGKIINTISENGESREIYGAHLKINTFLLGRIGLSFFAQTYKSFASGEEENRYPLFYAGGTAYYRLIFGRSILRLGMKIFALGEKQGMRFIPQTRAYIEYPYRSSLTFNGLEVFARARLGNAYVKAAYQNVLSRGYYFVPVYPGLDANFRLSFSWSFMN